MRWRVRSLGALLTVLVAAAAAVGACGDKATCEHGSGAASAFREVQGARVQGAEGRGAQVRRMRGQGGQGQGARVQGAEGQGAQMRRMRGQGGNCEAGQGSPGQGGEGQGDIGGGEGFNGTDAAWIQLMVAMNEQVLPLLDLASGELKTPAMTVRAGHLEELTTLKALRKQAGLTEANPHAGHIMPGLVTEDDIRASATDKTRLASKVIEHLEQRILLAKGVSSSGTSKGVKSLAKEIEQASIDALASWRALSMEWAPSVHPSKEI